MIHLNEQEIFILGRPNFACARMAKLLISSGLYEDKAKKAEYEQAVFIHWAMDLYGKHGDKWTYKADEILQDLNEKQKERLGIEGGAA